MGIGDGGLGIGDWGLGPITNPQSPSLLLKNYLYNINKLYQIINNLKMILKSMLNKIEKGFSYKPDSQVIIHTEINHYKPLKEYIINLNEIVDSYNQKYKRNISPENFIISREKYSRNKNNEYNEQIFQKQLNNIPFSKFNNTNNNNFSTQLIRPIKPYKKKSILFN